MAPPPLTPSQVYYGISFVYFAIFMLSAFAVYACSFGIYFEIDKLLRRHSFEQQDCGRIAMEQEMLRYKLMMSETLRADWRKAKRPLVIAFIVMAVILCVGIALGMWKKTTMQFDVPEYVLWNTGIASVIAIASFIGCLSYVGSGRETQISQLKIADMAVEYREKMGVMTKFILDTMCSLGSSENDKDACETPTDVYAYLFDNIAQRILHEKEMDSLDVAKAELRELIRTRNGKEIVKYVCFLEDGPDYVILKNAENVPTALDNLSNIGWMDPTAHMEQYLRSFRTFILCVGALMLYNVFHIFFVIIDTTTLLLLMALGILFAFLYIYAIRFRV